MKKIILFICLFIGCFVGLLFSTKKDEPKQPQGLHFNEESGGYCDEDTCYAPWLTLEEVKEIRRKKGKIDD